MPRARPGLEAPAWVFKALHIVHKSTAIESPGLFMSLATHNHGCTAQPSEYKAAPHPGFPTPAAASLHRLSAVQLPTPVLAGLCGRRLILRDPASDIVLASPSAAVPHTHASALTRRGCGQRRRETATRRSCTHQARTTRRRCSHKKTCARRSSPCTTMACSTALTLPIATVTALASVPTPEPKHRAQRRVILGNLIGPNGEQLTSQDAYKIIVFVGEETLRPSWLSTPPLAGAAASCADTERAIAIAKMRILVGGGWI
ncbi:hypothetical protein C8J57DRAFT_418523 [Mycena rebaudengoi]|nr:hypothetical protein C8J57DRAFT_418523 [Mycena rebaudengoi]